MANQICDCFKHEPDADAAEEIAHLRLFWDPRMRQQTTA